VERRLGVAVNQTRPRGSISVNRRAHAATYIQEKNAAGQPKSNRLRSHQRDLAWYIKRPSQAPPSRHRPLICCDINPKR
jgi:hypothetical protein